MRIYSWCALEQVKFGRITFDLLCLSQIFHRGRFFLSFFLRFPSIRSKSVFSPLELARSRSTTRHLMFGCYSFLRVEFSLSSIPRSPSIRSKVVFSRLKLTWFCSTTLHLMLLSSVYIHRYAFFLISIKV